MSVNSLMNKYIISVNNQYDNVSINKIFGFWLYLLSDLILFACLFATYGVLVHGTADGPIGLNIFNLNLVFIETIILLFSSMSCGLIIYYMYKKLIQNIKLWLIITFLLGLFFILIEIYEFKQLIIEGYGPSRNAFLSAFFVLIGTHSIHVILGLGWMIIMFIHIYCNGLSIVNQMRLNCLSLFWHFLDIIWICVFTIVYLLGAIK